MQRHRLITYNYSSFTTSDIIKYFLGEDIDALATKLIPQRKTGISARMLGEILGDMWIIKRNPYIQEDLISNKKRRSLLLSSLTHRLKQMEERADGNQDSLALIRKTSIAIDEFSSWLNNYKNYRDKIVAKVSKSVKSDNIDFSPYSRSTATTDATDLRYSLPLAVLYPESEKEIEAVIDVCNQFNLTIIPQGGSTGYHGGIVPLEENTIVLNMEKFVTIGVIKDKQVSKTHTAATIKVGAGVITQQVGAAAKRKQLVFAVDPTSQDASTIGGNIATNAGGKKALLWGTAIDNLLSWRMITADGCWLDIHRVEHNMAKIHDQQKVKFTITKTNSKGVEVDKRQVIIDGNKIRKSGLGKDVTNKYLFGLPGVQKEGCDGIITSAEFVLHKQFSYTHTICLEFYSENLAESVSCITEIIKIGESTSDVFISALEHLDSYYINAINYSPKSDKNDKPNMLLLIDVSSFDKTKLDDMCELIAHFSTPFKAHGFIASTQYERDAFWQDRKKTAAIAKHTNAFKLNEDVVIPLPKLAEYSTEIAKINHEQIVANKAQIIEEMTEYLQHLITKKRYEEDSKIIKCINQIKTVHLQLKEQKKISIKTDIVGYMRELLIGKQYQEVITKIKDIHVAVRRKRLFIALHMHAGDGNVHTNIPVNSDSPQMMKNARELVKSIMKLAVKLDGVISGEHGIGITKAEFVTKKEIDTFVAYKKEIDPGNLFNRGKLTNSDSISKYFTPSLALLGKEAILLEASELGKLNLMIKDCLRCGKCKPVCATHVPTANILYSPRNKILATSALIEAFLYEEQTRRGISTNHFSSLLNVADHCTVCHRCENPCPVNIDFGDVTMLLRKIVRDKGHYTFRILPLLTITYLNMKNTKAINFCYTFVIKYGMKLHSIVSKIINLVPMVQRLKAKPPPTTKPSRSTTQVIHFLSRPLPSDLPVKPMRALLGVENDTYIPVFRKPENRNARAVFYFPGCGSERLFSKIGMATIAMLYELDLQVVLPPGYICCGYPQRASGYDAKSKTITAENQVLFHRIANSLSYLDIKKVVVSCGTCYDQLERYQLPSIFPEADLIDIHELLYSHKTFREKYKPQLQDTQGQKYIYHDPCHSPIKNNNPISLAKDLLVNESVELSARCCGESGSFAMERPDIATQVRESKAASLMTAATAVAGNGKPAKILTSCPACQQGLLRFKDETKMDTDYLIVEFANKIWGRSWQDAFIKKVKAEQGLEKILL